MIDTLPPDIIHELLVAVIGICRENTDEGLKTFFSLVSASKTIFDLCISGNSVFIQSLVNLTGSKYNAHMAIELAKNEVSDVKAGGESYVDISWLKKTEQRFQLFDKAVRNHSLVARLAHFVHALRLCDNKSLPEQMQKLCFSEEYDKVQAERAIYLYAVKGYSKETREEVVKECVEKGWKTCLTVFNALKGFIDEALYFVDLGFEIFINGDDQLADLSLAEQHVYIHEIGSDLEVFKDQILQSIPFSGIWKALGCIRGAWGEMALDVDWVQRHEAIGWVKSSKSEFIALGHVEPLAYWYDQWFQSHSFDLFCLVREWMEDTDAEGRA